MLHLPPPTPAQALTDVADMDSVLIMWEVVIVSFSPVGAPST